MDTIKGRVSGIIFSNTKTGFYVLKVDSKDLKNDEKVTGTFPGVNISKGASYSFSGVRGSHKTYGPQFIANAVSLEPEPGKIGVITYLQNYVPSVGPITAARLFDVFGDSLIQILDSSPEKLKDCAFLSEKQSTAIVEEWNKNKTQRQGTIFLSDMGFSGKQIKTILTAYPDRVQEIISTNPYLLSGLPGISLNAVDNIALERGYRKDSQERVEAIFLATLADLLSQEGHMYVTSAQIFEYATKRLFRKHLIPGFTHGDYISDSQYYKCIQSLTANNSIVVEDDRIYSPTSYVHEKETALSVRDFLLGAPKNWDKLDESLESFQLTHEISLSEEQKLAYSLLSKSNFLVVTGYPGTGKTTLISAFVHLFENANVSYTLMSPTGIAAKRLSQVTGKAASTIHRALGYKIDGTWEFHSGNKFYSDVVIVDEMSMVDSSTMHHLMTSIHPSSTIIMLGDVAQLPSVGSGFVLHQLSNCDIVPCVKLTRIYRQGKTSDIIQVAHKILRDEPIDTSFNKSSEFVFMGMSKDSISDEVCKLSATLKRSDKKFQVIAPMYDGDLGVNNLNLKLRSVLNPDVTKSSPHVKCGSSDIFEGDRVMFVKNDYDKLVFNGDVGKISRIDIKNDEIDVKIFDWYDPGSSSFKLTDKTITYSVEEARQNLKTAYACTAHKVQGQEFDYVIMPMVMDYSIMLYKNLIYTAITRAKNKVFIFGDPNAFNLAVTNARETNRNSNLALDIMASVAQM